MRENNDGFQMPTDRMNCPAAARSRRGIRAFLLISAVVPLLAACGAQQDYNYPQTTYGKVQNIPNDIPGSAAGPDGLVLFSTGGNESGEGGGGSGVAVNTYLWRASLDTISFMPLSSADPFGGVIITDWYSPPDSGNERFKVNIYILDRELRADGLRAAVFRQVRRGNSWRDVEVPDSMGTDIENSILTRARELRIASTTG